MSSHPIKTTVFLLNRRAATILATVCRHLHQTNTISLYFFLFFLLHKLQLGCSHKTLGKTQGGPGVTTFTCAQTERIWQGVWRHMSTVVKKYRWTMKISLLEIIQCLFHLCHVCNFFFPWFGIFAVNDTFVGEMKMAESKCEDKPRNPLCTFIYSLILNCVRVV